MEVAGRGEDVGDSVRYLNRVITYTKEGIEFEPDQRLVEALIDDLRLAGSNTSAAPGSKPNPITKEAHQKLMERRLGARKVEIVS